MRKKLDKEISRRTFLKGAAAGMVLLGPGVPYIAQQSRALAEEKEIGWHGPYPYRPPVAGFNARYENAKIIKTYDASNASLIKDLVPDTMYDFLTKPEKWGPFKINEMEYIKYEPPAGYKEATEKYKGTCKIGPKGELQNWVAGLPFENPKTGSELIWTFEKRYQADDFNQESIAVITERSGSVRHIMDVAWRRLYMVGRTMVDPKPVYPNDQGLELIDSYGYHNPYDMKGLIPMYQRYTDPLKADDGWLYIPSMRRTRRMSTAQRMDSIGAGGDATWDDFQNFSGKVLQYDWKLVGQRMALLPSMAKGKGEWVEGRFLSGVNDRYRRVNAYILECIPKDPNHVYSKKVYWVDPESFHMPYGQYYDRKGSLWKVFNFHIAFDSKGSPYSASMYCVDIQRMHATLYMVYGYSGNIGLTPHRFSWEELKKDYPSAR